MKTCKPIAISTLIIGTSMQKHEFWTAKSSAITNTKGPGNPKAVPKQVHSAPRANMPSSRLLVKIGAAVTTPVSLVTEGRCPHPYNKPRAAAPPSHSLSWPCP